jgi:predicted MFS family arabinose efflux permease
VQGSFGADKTAIGLISSAMTFTYFLGLFIFLQWKRLHPRYMLWLASWTMAFCIAVYMVIPVWAVTFIFHGLFGLGMSLFWPRIMGWLSWGVEGKDLGTTMGKFNSSWSFGGILAPYIGGLLVEADPRLPFAGAFILLIATGLLMPIGSRLYPNFKKRQTQGEPDREGADPAASTAAVLSPLRYPGRIAVVGTYFLSGAIIFIFPAFAKETLGFSESLIGSFLLVRMSVATAGFSLWGRWTFWHFKFWPLAAVTLLLISMSLVFPIVSQPWQFYLLFAAVGLAFSFIYTYALFHGVTGSKHREQSMSIHEGAINLGLFSGTILGGWVSEAWSMDGAFYLCAAIVGCILVVQTALYVQQRRKAIAA